MKFMVKLGMLVVGWSLGFVFSGPTGLFLSRGNAIKLASVVFAMVCIGSLATKFVNRKPVKKRW